MNGNVLFRLVKDYGINKETFIEHAIKTYHVGTFLFERLKLNVEKKKYLYACFFHDVGKLVIEIGKEGHSPRSKEGLELLTTTEEYKALLQNFELDDYSQDVQVLRAIEKHHDSEDEFGAFVSIADQIASSNSNEDLKNRLKKMPISSLITYLNEMRGFNKFNFFNLEIPSFSKNELNSIGKLLLLKLLYETIEDLNASASLLYETLNGCRVVTPLALENFRELICDRFNANVLHFFKEQNLTDLIGGAPDGYKQYCTLPKELKSELEELTIKKYIADILKALKKAQVKKIEDIGLNDGILLKFVNLSEVQPITGRMMDFKYKLLADVNGRYSLWVKDTFNLKNIEVDEEAQRPWLEDLLEKAGANTGSITQKKIVYEKICSMTKAVNSVRSCPVEFTFDLSEFLAIDGSIPLNNIAKQTVCANCGIFEGFVPLETFTFGYRQHYRESLFNRTNDEIRKGEILVCRLCHTEALLNSILCGITIENQRARVNPKTHLILYGIDIDKDLINELTDKKLVERLLRDFKITKESIYVKKRTDLHIILFSLAEYNVGIKNDKYRYLLFSLIASRLKERNPLILAFSVNVLPSLLNNEILQFAEKKITIVHGTELDFFEYVYVFVTASYEHKRDYILRYYKKPLVGIAQIFKRENAYFDEEVQQVVEKMAQNDVLYEITDQIWEMARIGGGLETGRNVGSFLGVFKGRPEDIDRIANTLLKNVKLSAEQRAKIVEIHDKLRTQLKQLPEEKRRELKDYAQTTKYLFNSKKFYEIKKAKEIA